MRAVETWGFNSERVVVTLSDDAFEMGTEAGEVFPANVASLTAWWRVRLEERAKREARRRRKPYPRGRAHLARMAILAETTARACLVELELGGLVIQVTEVWDPKGTSGMTGMRKLPEEFGPWYARGVSLERAEQNPF